MLPGPPTCTSAAPITTMRRSPARRAGVAFVLRPRTYGMPSSSASMGTTHAATPTSVTNAFATAAPTGPTQFSPRICGGPSVMGGAEGSPAYDARASERNTANVHKRSAATSRPRANVCGCTPSTFGRRVFGGGARNELDARRGAKTGSDRTFPVADAHGRPGSPAMPPDLSERPAKRLRSAIPTLTYTDARAMDGRESTPCALVFARCRMTRSTDHYLQAAPARCVLGVLHFRLWRPDVAHANGPADAAAPGKLRV